MRCYKVKKYISTNKFYIALSYYLLITSFLIITGSIIMICEENIDAVIPLVILMLFFGSVLWLCNRTSCWIWIENGYIKRRGLWFGFKQSVKINDIQSVKFLCVNHGSLFLVDSNRRNFHFLSKKSYISFCITKNNLKFLSTFWNGNVDGYESWRSQI